MLSFKSFQLNEVAEQIKFTEVGVGMTNHTITKKETVNGITIAVIKKGPAFFVAVASKGTSLDGGKVDGKTISVTASIGTRGATKMFKAGIESIKSGESDVTAITKAARAGL